MTAIIDITFANDNLPRMLSIMCVPFGPARPVGRSGDVARLRAASPLGSRSLS